MPVVQPRHGMEEHARRGDAIYDRDIRDYVEPGDIGKYVAIDIETGAYEVDANELAASDRLLARVPDAQTWLRRIGSRYARRIGSRPPAGRPMITGIVTADREAIILLKVRGPFGQEEVVEAVIDTGFDGSLSLPPSLIAGLQLAWRRRGRALLADGSESVFDIHEGVVLWDGVPVRVAIDAVDMVPLIGMSLLEGFQLTVEVRHNGQVTIEALP